MNVRDALEADADALATMADAPTDVMRNLVHDRTVRVAEDATRDQSRDVTNDRFDGSDPHDLLGFVSFDAREDTVYVTQIDGTAAACERLLAEPVRFAERESMAVEALVPSDHHAIERVLDSQGFSRLGRGPRFEGLRTARFRLEP